MKLILCSKCDFDKKKKKKIESTIDRTLWHFCKKN